MLMLRHNELSSQDLFTIECLMIKVADEKYSVQDLNHFTIFDKSRAELYGYILGFSERIGLCESLGITPSEYLDFIVDIDRGYLPNAYHSFFHAVDVMIVLYNMICQYDILNYISRIDVAALIIAGLCHDIGHPGMNNNYQVNLKTDLAIRYSNKSVLESYSCTLTMDILTKHKLLRNLECKSKLLGLPTTEPEMRTSIIKMILATDMIFHFELQENLANILEIINDTSHHHHHNTICNMHTLKEEEEEEEEEEERADLESDEDIQVKDIFTNNGAKSAITYFRRKSYFEEDMIPLSLKTIPILPASPKEEEEKKIVENVKNYSSGIDLMYDIPPNFIIEPQQRLILCQIILHAADISNALRPWSICLSWSNLVCEEFFNQGESEKLHGLKVSPNMDRNQTSQTTIGLQFGDFIVSPYFEIFAALFPKSDELLKTLSENRKQWLRLEEELKVKNVDTYINERLPISMLPDRPIINPTGRRVSVAAGMIIIPDELEERTIGVGKNKRKYLGIRSVSYSDISNTITDSNYKKKRRNSEEPNLFLLSRHNNSNRFSRRSSKQITPANVSSIL